MLSSQLESAARRDDLLAGAALLDEAGIPNAWELARFAVSRRHKPLRLAGDRIFFGNEFSRIWSHAFGDDMPAASQALMLLGVAIPVTSTPELRQLFGQGQAH